MSQITDVYAREILDSRGIHLPVVVNFLQQPAPAHFQSQLQILAKVLAGANPWQEPVPLYILSKRIKG